MEPQVVELPREMVVGMLKSMQMEHADQWGRNKLEKTLTQCFNGGVMFDMGMAVMKMLEFTQKFKKEMRHLSMLMALRAATSIEIVPKVIGHCPEDMGTDDARADYAMIVKQVAAMLIKHARVENCCEEMGQKDMGAMQALGNQNETLAKMMAEEIGVQLGWKNYGKEREEKTNNAQ